MMAIRNPSAGRLRPTALAAALMLLGGLSLPAQAIDLLQAYDLALQHDARYQMARAETAAAREAKPQALAQLLPNISASLQRSERGTDSKAPNMFGKMVSRHQDYMSSNYAISLRQPLYRPYNFVLYQQAQAQVASAEAMLDRNLQELLVRLAGAYFDALGAEDQLSLALSQKEAYGGQLSMAQRRFEAGEGTRTDIDDAQARLDLALAQELEAQQQLDQARRQLQSIIGRPVQQLAGLIPERLELLPPYPARVEDWVSRGQEVNPELRALRANIEAAEREVGKAGSGHKPTLDLVAQRSRSTSDGETVINQQFLTTNVGLQLNIPIFAGGYNSSQVRQAEANLDKVRQQYEGRRREIELAIRKEFQNVAQGVLKVRAHQQVVRSSEQALISSQKGHQAGTRTLVDILNAEQQRMSARRDLTNARHQYLMARIKLQDLVGSLGLDELSTLNLWLDHNGRDAEPTATVPESQVDDAATSTTEPQAAPRRSWPEVFSQDVQPVAALPAVQAQVAPLYAPPRFAQRAPVLQPFRLAQLRCAAAIPLVTPGQSGTDEAAPSVAVHFPLVEYCPQPAGPAGSAAQLTQTSLTIQSAQQDQQDQQDRQARQARLNRQPFHRSAALRQPRGA